MRSPNESWKEPRKDGMVKRGEYVVKNARVKSHSEGTPTVVLSHFEVLGSDPAHASHAFHHSEVGEGTRVVWGA